MHRFERLNMNTEKKKILLRRSLRKLTRNTKCIPEGTVDSIKPVKPKVTKKVEMKPTTAQKTNRAKHSSLISVKNKKLNSKVVKTVSKNLSHEKTANDKVDKEVARQAVKTCNKKLLRKRKNRCGHFIIDCSEIVGGIRINVYDLVSIVFNFPYNLKRNKTYLPVSSSFLHLHTTLVAYCFKQKINILV